MPSTMAGSAPTFTIDEADSDACRAWRFEEKSGLVAEIQANEMKRRDRRASKLGAGDDEKPTLFHGGGQTANDEESDEA